MSQLREPDRVSTIDSRVVWWRPMYAILSRGWALSSSPNYDSSLQMSKMKRFVTFFLRPLNLRRTSFNRSIHKLWLLFEMKPANFMHIWWNSKNPTLVCSPLDMWTWQTRSCRSFFALQICLQPLLMSLGLSRCPQRKLFSYSMAILRTNWIKLRWFWRIGFMKPWILPLQSFPCPMTSWHKIFSKNRFLKSLKSRPPGRQSSKTWIFKRFRVSCVKDSVRSLHSSYRRWWVETESFLILTPMWKLSAHKFLRDFWHGRERTEIHSR